MSKYKVIAKLFDGKNLVGYEVYSVSENKSINVNLNDIKALALSGSLINAKYNNKTRLLTGINGYDMRKLEHKNLKTKNNDTVCYVGDQAIRYAKQLTNRYSNKRYLWTDLMKYLKSDNRKVCALYGLRRTGKTVLMLQSLIDIKSKSVAYMTLTDNNSMHQVLSNVKRLVDLGIKYIFIDEITEVTGFIHGCALLADAYTSIGVRIVISGTSSYAIELASRQQLYDRVIKMNTSYISYNEYCHLLGDTSVLDYIRLGGLLSTDSFYNKTSAKHYIDTAITHNIESSLEKLSSNRYADLMNLADRGLLSKAIEQAVQSSNGELTTDVISRVYRNYDLGSAKQLLGMKFDIQNKLDEKEITDRIRYKFRVLLNCDTEITSKHIDELSSILQEIGVFITYDKYTGKGMNKHTVYLFVQPGLRYRQTVDLIDSICESESFRSLSRDARMELKRTIINDTEGQMLEQLVLVDRLWKYMNNESITVTQYTSNGKEIDMIIQTEGGAYLYEVKRSTKVVGEQAKWLVDDSFNKEIEFNFGKILGRCVIYTGKTTDIVYKNKHIQYINVADYLKGGKCDGII